MARLRAGLIFLVAFVLLLHGQIPPASFSGTVHDLSKKQITLETPEGNLLDFDINKKTRVQRGKREIAAEDLHTGDLVTIEARQEFGKYLVALTITAGAGAKTN